MIRPALGLAAVICTAFIAGCGGGDDASTTVATTAASACPVAPISVVVTVDQWGGIVKSLAGACANVDVVIAGSAGDPHDYEPTSADAAKFTNATLVVENGLDYDHWADSIVDTLSPTPAVVNGGDVVGLTAGANPHIWYGPTYVTEVAGAVTAKMKALMPGAADYLDTRAAAWTASMAPYRDEVTAIKSAHSGATYGATEWVFQYMADAIGLKDVTAQGYRNAAANKSDPSPGDLNAFEATLRDTKADVLIFNTQTEGAIPDQVRTAAEAAGVPVVNVTETVPPGAKSFEEWQVSQLKSLSKALGA